MWQKTATLVFLFALFIATPVLASETNGVINPSYKYAWGENMGWLNFAATSTGDVYNGLNITSSAVTGYAWSSAGGWINFAPNNGGVTNDGNGILGGYAWSSQKGWIDMTGVMINTATGKFSGTAGTSGSTAGRINFSCDNCDVRTDWRPISICTAWTYSSWSNCLNNHQTRSVLSASPTNCTGGSPVLSQSCQFNNGGGGGAPVTPPVTTPVTSTTTLTLPITIPTVDQSKVDITSIEYKKWNTEVVKLADVIQDGVIDIFDFNSLMVNWGKKGQNIVADVNQNGEVDIFDFNSLMVHWGQTEVKI